MTTLHPWCVFKNSAFGCRPTCLLCQSVLTAEEQQSIYDNFYALTYILCIQWISGCAHTHPRRQACTHIHTHTRTHTSNLHAYIYICVQKNYLKPKGKQPEPFYGAEITIIINNNHENIIYQGVLNLLFEDSYSL